MPLKITFLGSGSAFTIDGHNYQSNLLLEKDNDSLLIDAGGDIRFSLHELGMSHTDIRNVYISHLHADHIGGLEWLAMNTYFDPNYHGKPNLYCSEDIIDDLWNRSLAGGLSTLDNERASLETFFNLYPIKQGGGFVWNDISFQLVESIHVVSKYTPMPCYGLFIDTKSNLVYFTCDTKIVKKYFDTFYKEATIIFHDCEITAEKSGVHAHYTDLKFLPEALKKKMWLYHYNSQNVPNAVAEGFQGFVKKGQSFIV